jgi:hypothetical protein
MWVVHHVDFNRSNNNRENRIGRTTQAAPLTRIKAFFRWATGMEFITRNPTLMLKAITPDESKTWPLTPKQFDELLEATYRLDVEAEYKSARVGQHLRALLPVTFTSTTTSICTVSGTTATFIASGTCTIDANQAGNSTYVAATMVPQSFTVNPAPTLRAAVVMARSASYPARQQGTQ